MRLSTNEKTFQSLYFQSLRELGREKKKVAALERELVEYKKREVEKPKVRLEKLIVHFTRPK